MESKQIVTISSGTFMSGHECTRTLAPTTVTFQGIAAPIGGLRRRPRPATSGTDHRPRTP